MLFAAWAALIAGGLIALRNAVLGLRWAVSGRRSTLVPVVPLLLSRLAFALFAAEQRSAAPVVLAAALAAVHLLWLLPMVAAALWRHRAARRG